jgi:hypothetical protein
MIDENLARGGSSIDSPRLRLVFGCSAGLMVLAALGLGVVLLRMDQARSFADLLVTIAQSPTSYWPGRPLFARTDLGRSSHQSGLAVRRTTDCTDSS